VGVALDAGVPWIQLRTKLGPRAPFPKFSDRAALATQLKKMCDAANAQLFINDEPSLAATCGAHLHMGQSDYSIATAREQLTATPWIGITCHNNIGLAKTAEQQGADYVSFGAFFSSHTKPNAHPASLDILTHPDQPPLPRVAIGGITLHNANQLLAAGADVLAVSHAILGAEDLRQACRDFLTLLSNTELRSNALNEKKQLEHG
jgi:thiamine-phosphate pyrophosphorylase